MGPEVSHKKQATVGFIIAQPDHEKETMRRFFTDLRRLSDMFPERRPNVGRFIREYQTKGLALRKNSSKKVEVLQDYRILE